MRFFFVTVLTLFIFAACSKSNSGGRPSLTLDNISKTVDSFSNLEANFTFHNGSASLSGGTLNSLRMRINQKPPLNVSGSDTVNSPIPDYPDQSKGTYNLELPYQGYLTTGSDENDTLIFKFWVIDIAGKSSDTLTSPKVVILN